MLSFWEKKYFTHHDFIIIGSGIVGLTTAYYLRKNFPNKSIVILERGLLPTGASTKNAGFACMGSATELLDDLTQATEDEVKALFLLRKNGLTRLTSIIGEQNIGYQTNGSYELIGPNEEYALNKIDYLNSLLQDLVEGDAFRLSNENISRFGFNTNHVTSLIENRCEGEIDTGLMMRNLIRLVTSIGVEIKTGCDVSQLQEEGKFAILNCKSFEHSANLTFTCQQVFVCTNAFAKTLLPSLDVTPGRGQVLITKPIDNLPFKGIFHMQQGYYYFRVYENRVLFGGGRNLDFATETTTSFDLNEMIQTDLIQKLKEIILPNHAFEIDQQWAGIMGFGGNTKQFILQKHSERILVGVRMNGMGVAIGSEVGFQLAGMADK